MDLDRFRALADAYGGDLRRWPAAERAAAAALRDADAGARALLDAEAGFDHLLHQAPAPVPAALRAAVLAGAPKPRGRRAAWRLWVSGAGLAATAAAGALAGAVWISTAAQDVRTESLLAAAAPEDGAQVASWLAEGDT
jgi:hypothetical protein